MITLFCLFNHSSCFFIATSSVSYTLFLWLLLPVNARQSLLPYLRVFFYDLSPFLDYLPFSTPSTTSLPVIHYNFENKMWAYRLYLRFNKGWLHLFIKYSIKTYGTKEAWCGHLHTKLSVSHQSNNYNCNNLHFSLIVTNINVTCTLHSKNVIEYYF